ncbi:MAG: asparagine synthetase B, partial [Gloeomargaritaceae cyanobacterium C42_A2020_066]|nr:asparagine synthetase B [Gloeomargaritaceae cyanobacterium C42_A2020_066]
MIAPLTHRGPDGEGTWVDADAGLGLGHRRLAILDLSPAGQQPMVDAAGRWVVVFNGEIYNFRELRQELDQAGARFRGHSDTEVLLNGVRQWGILPTLARACGMFALALWDRQTRTLTLARDRMGEKPLYYGWLGHTFIFGSELKALRAAPSWRGEVSRPAVAQLLRWGYIPAPETIYTDIYKLPAGHWLQVQMNGSPVASQPYWSLAEVAEASLSQP